MSTDKKGTLITTQHRIERRQQWLCRLYWKLKHFYFILNSVISDLMGVFFVDIFYFFLWYIRLQFFLLCSCCQSMLCIFMKIYRTKQKQKIKKWKIDCHSCVVSNLFQSDTNKNWNKWKILISWYYCYFVGANTFFFLVFSGLLGDSFFISISFSFIIVFFFLVCWLVSNAI